ncbi:hypothetical protein TYRP_019831 [Tyrophagus putrescentiae]|nr:hypothetical protein TYRP_019831 [Tyrophagus putrescentiae]
MSGKIDSEKANGQQQQKIEAKTDLNSSTAAAAKKLKQTKPLRWEENVKTKQIYSSKFCYN